MYQRRACQHIALKRGWKISQEFFEKENVHKEFDLGIQDGLKIIRDDAASGKFDILLVFNMDCIGRKPEESPFVINFLIAQGVKTYSVCEGKQQVKIDAQRLTALALELQLA